MPWVRIWAEGRGQGSYPEEKWEFYSEVPSEECLKDEAMEFAESFSWLRESERGYKYGSDDPVERLPELVRTRMLAGWIRDKAFCDTMIARLQPPTPPLAPLDRMAKALEE